jgi:hypothetical protein
MEAQPGSWCADSARVRTVKLAGASACEREIRVALNHSTDELGRYRGQGETGRRNEWRTECLTLIAKDAACKTGLWHGGQGGFGRGPAILCHLACGSSNGQGIFPSVWRRKCMRMSDSAAEARATLVSFGTVQNPNWAMSASRASRVRRDSRMSEAGYCGRCRPIAAGIRQTSVGRLQWSEVLHVGAG